MVNEREWENESAGKHATLRFHPTILLLFHLLPRRLQVDVTKATSTIMSSSSNVL